MVIKLRVDKQLFQQRLISLFTDNRSLRRSILLQNVQRKLHHRFCRRTGEYKYRV